MISKIVLNIIVAALATFGLMEFAFDGLYITKNIIDAVFVIGMLFTSLGIITTTNAGNAFQGITYGLQKTFGRKKFRHLAFYDYKEQKDREKTRSTGLPTLFVGVLMIIASAYIGFNYFS
jgi:hypothetical protein